MLENTKWSIAFGVILDCIWWRRNEIIFQDTSHNIDEILFKVWALLRDIKSSQNM